MAELATDPRRVDVERVCRKADGPAWPNGLYIRWNGLPKLQALEQRYPLRHTAYYANGGAQTTGTKLVTDFSLADLQPVAGDAAIS